MTREGKTGKGGERERERQAAVREREKGAIVEFA